MRDSSGGKSGDAATDGPAAKQLLESVAGHCLRGDFPQATQELRECPHPIPAESMLELPATVNALVSAGAFGGPYTFVEQLRLLFADDEIARCRSECVIPVLIAEHLFETGIRVANRGISERKWSTVDSVLGLLVTLPGASQRRSQHLLEIAAELVSNWRTLEQRIVAECGPRHRPLRGHEWGAFRINLSLPLAAAESAGYPELAAELLLKILGEAEWPTFGAMDVEWIAVLWPDLEAIHDRRDSVPLSICAREWLSRLIAKPGPQSPDEEIASP